MPTAVEGDAADIAAAAAGRAGVRVRSATNVGDCVALVRLFEDTWGVGRSPDAAMLQALAHAGNTVLLAEEADGKPIGGLVGFLGWEGGAHVHSHMAAVAPSRIASGVGYALKLHQRAVCIEQGVPEVRWTYDPLIRRNAHFNLVKLGAQVTAFLPDFYGVLDDAVSGTDRSDRFEVSWRLSTDRVVGALQRRAPPSTVPANAARLVLQHDFESLRRIDPVQAGELREQSRAIFDDVLSQGLRIEFMAGAYVFLPDPQGDPTVGVQAEGSPREH